MRPVSLPPSTAATNPFPSLPARLQPLRHRLPLLVAALTLLGCQASSLSAIRSSMGAPRRSSDMLAVLDMPGPVTVETFVSAHWQVDRGGLIDLDDPRAKAAGLKDGDEPIEIYAHAIRHPTFGLYLIDTGVETAERDAPDKAKVQGLVRRFMNVDKLRVSLPLGEWLKQQSVKLEGVFLTHLHLDHIWGGPDLPKGTPLYTGPGEGAARKFDHLFVQGLTDDLLEGQTELREWAFTKDVDGRFAGVLDIFGDGSLWALWTPGHTPGSTAFIARTPEGPVLITGDTCHTAWGWRNGVPPGSFTADRAENQRSLDALRKLAAEHPQLRVVLGHQRLSDEPSAEQR